MSRCNSCKHMMCPFPEDMCIELCVCTLQMNRNIVSVMHILQVERRVANVLNKILTKMAIVFIMRGVNNEYLSC
jgi:hypothetical protein